MINKRKVILAILFMCVSFSGCGEADMEGTLLEVSEREVLISEDLSTEAYEGPKDESAVKLQNEDVRGERTSLRLMDLTYDKIVELHKGDQVEVWLKGDILESYPGQAEARSIVV